MTFVNVMGLLFAIAVFFSPFLTAWILIDFLNDGRSKTIFMYVVERRYSAMSVEKRNALTSTLARHFVISGIVWILMLLVASYTAPSWFFLLWGFIAHVLSGA